MQFARDSSVPPRREAGAPLVGVNRGVRARVAHLLRPSEEAEATQRASRSALAGAPPDAAVPRVPHPVGRQAFSLQGLGSSFLRHNVGTTRTP